MAKRAIKKKDKKESTMEQIYLKDVLKKDTKLAKFISNTLNYDPASDTDVGSEINTEFPPLISTSSGLIQVELIEQTSEQVDVSLIDSQDIEDDPELTFYFAEPNDKERECVAAHVKRIKRELEESTKRKANQQPKQMTGSEVGNSVRKVMKSKRHRRRRLPAKNKSKSKKD